MAIESPTRRQIYVNYIPRRIQTLFNLSSEFFSTLNALLNKYQGQIDDISLQEDLCNSLLPIFESDLGINLGNLKKKAKVKKARVLKNNRFPNSPFTPNDVDVLHLLGFPAIFKAINAHSPSQHEKLFKHYFTCLFKTISNYYYGICEDCGDKISETINQNVCTNCGLVLNTNPTTTKVSHNRASAHFPLNSNKPTKISKYRIANPMMREKIERFRKQNSIINRSSCDIKIEEAAELLNRMIARIQYGGGIRERAMKLLTEFYSKYYESEERYHFANPKYTVPIVFYYLYKSNKRAFILQDVIGHIKDTSNLFRAQQLLIKYKIITNFSKSQRKGFIRYLLYKFQIFYDLPKTFSECAMVTLTKNEWLLNTGKDEVTAGFLTAIVCPQYPEIDKKITEIATYYSVSESRLYSKVRGLVKKYKILNKDYTSRLNTLYCILTGRINDRFLDDNVDYFNRLFDDKIFKNLNLSQDRIKYFDSHSELLSYLCLEPECQHKIKKFHPEVYEKVIIPILEKIEFKKRQGMDAKKLPGRQSTSYLSDLCVSTHIDLNFCKKVFLKSSSFKLWSIYNFMKNSPNITTNFSKNSFLSDVLGSAEMYSFFIGKDPPSVI